MNRKRGFMLIEFLAVVVLSTILAVVVPRVTGTALHSESSVLVTNPVGAYPEIESYGLHRNGRLPATSGELGMICPRRLGRVFKIQTQPDLY